MAELLPTEIWYQIFFEACIDGGRTACALSEVSQYFRHIVLPLQLDNVSLIGLQEIERFASLLRSRERHPELCRVQHLFLWNSRRYARIAEALACKKSRAAFQYILGRTTPKLITFTDGFMQRQDGYGSILSFPCPKLQELTIRCPFMKFDLASQPNLKPSFPSLRYLHIISSPENAYEYTQYAPNLTHLRFPFAGVMSPHLYRAIQFAVKPDDAATTESPDRTAMPSPPPFKLTRKLEKIFIQADPFVMLSGFQSGPASYQRLLRNHPSLDAKKIVLVDNTQAIPGSGNPLRSAERKNWEERIVGGPGCWAEPSNIPRVHQGGGDPQEL